MILDSTTKSLEVLLAGAVATAQPVWYAAWADHTSVAFTPGAADGLTNGATAVTAVAAPASGVQRQIKLLTLFNNDTASVIATVRVNNNAALRTIIKVTLAIGDTLEWDPANGWKVITAAGNIKSGVGPAGATGEIQFNNGGVLGSDPDLLWDTGSNELRFGSAAKTRMAGQNRFRYLNAMVKAKRTTNQTLTTATWTAIGLDSEDFDTDAMHDNITNNSRVTFNLAGKYAIHGFGSFANNTTVGYRLIGLRLNGVTFIAMQQTGPLEGTRTPRGAVSDVISAIVGDYVELVAFQDTGADLVFSSADGISLSAYFIGE